MFLKKKNGQTLAFCAFVMYNKEAEHVMKVESCAISAREPCQVRKEAAVSAVWDVLRGRSV